VTLKLTGVPASAVQLLDTLYGWSQDALVHAEEGGAVIPDVLAGDWPLMVLLKTEE
jgi:hypothetical protein